MATKIRAEFGPGGDVAFVDPGTPVVEAAAIAGIELQTPCGGKGKCGQCRVMTRSDNGLTPPDEIELASLEADDIAAGTRLACRASIVADVRIDVPETSRIVGSAILEYGLVEASDPAPNVACTPLDMPDPALDDQRSDLRRVLVGLPDGSLSGPMDLTLLRDLPATLRDSGFSPTAVTIGGRLADVREPDFTQAYGAAVDIGTTTVVVYLVDLATGRVVGTGSGPNPQGAHGADVVSRVEFADTGDEALATLSGEAIAVVDEAIAEACAEAGSVRCENIYEVVVVGNACMTHLFLGLTPHHVARAPYIPVVDQPVRVVAADAGLRINPRGEVYLLPNIAGWVGADTVGVLLSTKLADSEGPTAAIDIGTNGEVMLHANGKTLVCSTAAGPAFEGAQIQDGMRAATGAIEHVAATDGEISISTIGDAPAVGLCGSGLLDALAALLDLGVVNSAGRMADDAAAEELPEAIRARLGGDGQERQFILVPADETASGNPIVITQGDVRQLQLAKGAVRAGLDTLVRELGLQATDLDRILLAGAFGSYIDRRSAVRIGLVPPLPLTRIAAVGNAAGAGAVLALASTEERTRAVGLAEDCVHIELSSRADFQMLFMETMMFPSA